MPDEKEEKTGISAAVDGVLSDINQDIIGWSGQQLSLLPSAAMVGDGLSDDEKRPEAGKRGRGRPPGAANKTTLDWAKYIGANYTNPLIFLAECVNRPVTDLAKELSCTAEKAFAFQMAAATKLTEFTNQKMPTTLDLGVDGDLSLIIQTCHQAATPAPGDDAALVGGPLIIDLPAPESDANTLDVVNEPDQTPQ